MFSRRLFHDWSRGSGDVPNGGWSREGGEFGMRRGGRGGHHGHESGHGRGHGGPDEWSRGRGGFGRGGGGGRIFGPGDLRLMLLALIAEKPRHGYELIKEIEQKFGGAYSPSPGSIYPTLTQIGRAHV